jgi:hypothetical protein
LDREYAVLSLIREWGRGLGGLDRVRRPRRCRGGKALWNLLQVGFGVDGIDIQLLQLSFSSRSVSLGLSWNADVIVGEYEIRYR